MKFVLKIIISNSINQDTFDDVTVIGKIWFKIIFLKKKEEKKKLSFQNMEVLVIKKC